MGTLIKNLIVSATIIFTLQGNIRDVSAQDMEPRAYSNAPIGTNFLVGGYAYSSGGLSLNPSLPVTDVEAKINTEILGYSRFFNLAGRTASWGVLLSNFDGDISGNIGENRQMINRTGLGDARARLAINLLGGPALTPEKFAVRTPATTVGLSTTIVAPTGEYTSQHLINIGTNRWAFKPEIGISQPIGNWFLEGSVGTWFFTNNENFYGGRQREQDVITSFQFHSGYNFSPGVWLAADATYWNGGETTLDGVMQQDRQSSSRLGVTLSLPLSKSVSFKLAWSNGLSTRIGSDFETVGASLQYRWFD